MALLAVASFNPGYTGKNTRARRKFSHFFHDFRTGDGQVDRHFRTDGSGSTSARYLLVCQGPRGARDRRQIMNYLSKKWKIL